MRDWLRAAVQLLVATGITAALACLGWAFVMREKGGLYGVVEECIGAAHPNAGGPKPVGTGGLSPAESSAAKNSPGIVNGGSIVRNGGGARVGNGGAASSFSSSCDDSTGSVREALKRD